MELKVRVDGITRVVCGVSRNHTCEDIVRALAVATSQAGRFTLIEKFRNNERFLSPGEKPIQVLNKWGEYANDVQFVLKRFCDSLNNNQLLTERQPNQHLLKNGHDNECHPGSNGDLMWTKKSAEVSGTPSSAGKQKTSVNITTHLISPSAAPLSDPKPLTRPKHPPSYESVTKSLFHHSPPTTAFHCSSPRKRTSQETTAKPDVARHEDQESQQQPDTFSGKRANSHSAIPVSDAVDGPLFAQFPQQQPPPSSSPQCDQGEERIRSTCCWQNDLQEMRIKDEYDRKKLEKDQLLLKASGLEAEIAVCRQKIQHLSHQIKEEEDLMAKKQEEGGQESIERLKEQIALCETDLQRQNRESEEIQSELRSLEEALRSKYEQMESVMKEIRKENLNALSMEVPASSVLRSSALTSSSAASPFLKLHSEVMRQNQSASLLGSRFYNRIGSTRKMLTSPRDLETAVASNKNPQGVWV